MRRLFLGLMTCALLTQSFPAGAYDKPPFPRLATYWLANATYYTPDAQRQLALTNIAIIGTWPGWGSDVGVTPAQAVSAIKAINPNTLVFQYINNNEIQTSNLTFAEPANKAQSMGWFLYANGSGGTIVPSIWGNGNFNELNTTLFAPYDSSGSRWIEWYAHWAVRTYATPNPYLDGFFTDNVFWKPRVDGDWNRDGIKDSSSDPTVQLWYRQGYKQHFQTLAQAMPGKFQLANVADWGDPGSNVGEYAGMANGGLIESLIGPDYAPETWGGFNAMMNWYRRAMSYMAEPKLAVFHYVGDVGNLQGFRYAFTSCLMDDGYFAFDPGTPNRVPWFDEYGAKLGYATSAPPTASWQSGVYRRDFQNGIALVNPKGNGARQVFLEDDYVKISGSQDPIVNNGQTVRSVVLQDRDGIVLLRKGASTAPVVSQAPTPASSSSSTSSNVAGSSVSSSSSRAGSSASSAPLGARQPSPPSGVSVR